MTLELTPTIGPCADGRGMASDEAPPILRTAFARRGNFLEAHFIAFLELFRRRRPSGLYYFPDMFFFFKGLSLMTLSAWPVESFLSFVKGSGIIFTFYNIMKLID